MHHVVSEARKLNQAIHLGQVEQAICLCLWQSAGAILQFRRTGGIATEATPALATAAEVLARNKLQNL